MLIWYSPDVYVLIPLTQRDPLIAVGCRCYVAAWPLLLDTIHLQPRCYSRQLLPVVGWLPHDLPRLPHGWTPDVGRWLVDRVGCGRNCGPYLHFAPLLHTPQLRLNTGRIAFPVADLFQLLYITRYLCVRLLRLDYDLQPTFAIVIGYAGLPDLRVPTI